MYLLRQIWTSSSDKPWSHPADSLEKLQSNRCERVSDPALASRSQVAGRRCNVKLTKRGVELTVSTRPR